MVQKSTKALTASSLLFFAASLAVLLVFFQLVRTQKEELTTLTVEQARTADYKRAVSSLVRTLEETEAERASMFSRILKDDEVIGFLALIETLGKERGVTLTTNSLNVTPVNNEYERLVMNISAQGTYDAVMQTLKILETLPYQSTIRSFSLSKEGREAEAESWRSSYEVQVTKFKKNGI